VDRVDAIAGLPPTYQRVLLLVAGGCPDDEIARQLGVEAHAVRSLIDLAEAKLARLISSSRAGNTTGGEETP
jgi:DNA-directed RNA polymerase specialized sigma24 family protein